MEDSKKISKLLDEKAKAEEKVRRIHKLVFEGAKSDNTEMRILRNEFDKAKKQLNEIKEEIEQLRQKEEEKSKRTTKKPTVSKDVAQEEKTTVAKENKGIQELIRLVGNTTSVNKQQKNLQSLQKPVQPSVKPIENNNLKETKAAKPKDEGEDKKIQGEINKKIEEDRKPEEDKKTQDETAKKPEKKPEEKPQKLQERVKIDVINIRTPQTQKKIEPKPIIPSVRLR